MKKTRASGGFTLVELVITVLISGMLFFAIGVIVIQSQVSWMKNSRTAETFDDQLYARRFIEWQIRTSTGPYIIDGGAEQIGFHGYNETLGPGATTYRTIKLFNGRLLYNEYRYDPAVATKYVSLGPAEVIISSVSAFSVVQNPNDLTTAQGTMPSSDLNRLRSPSIFYGFSISPRRVVQTGETTELRTSTFSFVVSARNSDVQ